MRTCIAYLFCITEINVQKYNVFNFFQKNNAKIDSNDVVEKLKSIYIYL